LAGANGFEDEKRGTLEALIVKPVVETMGGEVNARRSRRGIFRAASAWRAVDSTALLASERRALRCFTART